MKNGAGPLISERLMIVHLEAVRYQYLQALHTANCPFSYELQALWKLEWEWLLAEF